VLGPPRTLTPIVVTPRGPLGVSVGAGVLVGCSPAAGSSVSSGIGVGSWVGVGATVGGASTTVTLIVAGALLVPSARRATAVIEWAPTPWACQLKLAISALCPPALGAGMVLNGRSSISSSSSLTPAPLSVPTTWITTVVPSANDMPLTGTRMDTSGVLAAGCWSPPVESPPLPGRLRLHAIAARASSATASKM